MGAFSSSNQMDFKAVLESFTKDTIPIPPFLRMGLQEWYEGEVLTSAGESLMLNIWEFLQRRKSIFLAADFREQRAKEISFDSQRLFHDPTIMQMSGYSPPLKIDYLLKKQG
ncbi:hypothetical protein [Carnobacterium mobile]|uniref:hypothetical protein n=1 Tax=Carnobacterium mobile TaxID=2750 RepID=UPI001D01F4D9|nr:hypothetical protein [Carnobacterium mobile]